MMDEYVAVPISLSNRRAAAQMDALLKQEGIERDRNITYSAAIYDDDGSMIATGSLFENTLRCLAVDGAHRGEGLMAVIVAHLVQVQLERGNTHLFLYTKADSAKFFSPLGFTEIACGGQTGLYGESARRVFALSAIACALCGKRSGRGTGDERESVYAGACVSFGARRKGKCPRGAFCVERGSLARSLSGSSGDGSRRGGKI